MAYPVAIGLHVIVLASYHPLGRCQHRYAGGLDWRCILAAAGAADYAGLCGCLLVAVPQSGAAHGLRRCAAVGGGLPRLPA